MNPLELRKVIQVGYRFDNVGALPILDARGMPTEPVKQRYWATIAFWIPAPKSFQRCEGKTVVPSIFPHELQALRDGAIIEHVQEFEFEQEPSAAEMRHRMLAVWDGLAHDSLKAEFNGAPVDDKTPMALQLSPIPKELSA